MAHNVSKRKSLPAWALVLVLGVPAWGVLVAAEWLTRVTTLIPSVIFVGSFLIPVAFLAWVFQRQDQTSREREKLPTALSQARIVRAFAVAGLFGVAIAAVFETLVISGPPALYYPAVAVIEDLIKLVILLLVALGLDYYLRRDGMVLGAAVGLGFAAFESAGYAFNTIVQHQEVDLGVLLETEIVRGLLSPFGHGLWTALVGGAFFAAAASAPSGRLRVTPGVVAWVLVAIALHTMWDLAAPAAAAATQWLTGSPVSWPDVWSGRIPNATATQAHLDGFLDWVFLSICGVIGLVIVVRQWHRGRNDRPVTVARTTH
ncbi:MAG: PrsW family glutamic-type intramembrane protease [Candidatus Nanopelagicales bacterium]|nr:PrsW family glutamic-type intramembrane protease [Candidatus Nanopelagicales bacterium]